MNVRHEIDPSLVREQIEQKIAGHERFRTTHRQYELAALAEFERAKAEGMEGLWVRPPRNLDDLDAMVDRWIKLEHEHYALVRVIELPIEGKRFILVYGDVDDSTVTSGTGPFETLEKAFDWFLKSGR